MGLISILSLTCYLMLITPAEPHQNHGINRTRFYTLLQCEMVEEYLAMCSTSLVIREMQIQTPLILYPGLPKGQLGDIENLSFHFDSTCY